VTCAACGLPVPHVQRHKPPLSYKKALQPSPSAIRSQQPWLRHRHIHGAVGQRGPQRVARLGLAHAGHRLAAGVGQQRITALQYQAWVQQLQPQGSTVQPLGVLAWAPLGRGVLTGKYRTATPADSRAASPHPAWPTFKK